MVSRPGVCWYIEWCGSLAVAVVAITGWLRVEGKHSRTPFQRSPQRGLSGALIVQSCVGLVWCVVGLYEL